MAYTTIDDPSLYFQIALYTGNGNTGKNIPLSSANFTGEYVGQEERMVLRVGGSSADGLWWGPPSVNGSNQSNPYGGQRILVDQQ